MEKLRNLCFFFPVAFFFICSWLAGSAIADFYKYIDKNGTVHFTDRYESIPKEYRDQIKTIREERWRKPPTEPSSDDKGSGQPGAKEPADRAKDTDLKREEESKAVQEKESQERKLKARQEKEKQIEGLRAQIQAKQQEKNSTWTTWMVLDRNKRWQLDQEIADLEKQIQEIQKGLAEAR